MMTRKLLRPFALMQTHALTGAGDEATAGLASLGFELAAGLDASAQGVYIHT